MSISVGFALLREELRTNCGRLRAADSAVSAAPPAEIISAKTLVEAQRLAAVERGRKLRMENDLKDGRLVEVEKASKVAFEAERIIRESLLNIPSRVAAELAAETDAVRLHIRLDAALPKP